MAEVSVGSNDVLLIGGLLLLATAGGLGLALGGRKIVGDVIQDTVQGAQEITVTSVRSVQDFGQGLVRGNDFTVERFTTPILPTPPSRIDASTFVNRPNGIPIVTPIPRPAGEMYVSGTTYDRNGRAEYEITTAPALPGKSRSLGARAADFINPFPEIRDTFRVDPDSIGARAINTTRKFLGRVF